MSNSAFNDVFSNRDWGKTGLGEMSGWPTSLKRAARLMLATPQPMFVVSGDDHSLIFNEAFTEILGSLWERALGHPLHSLWQDVWQVISPYMAEVMSGKAGIAEDIPIKTWASDFLETRYFSFSYLPLYGVNEDVVGGVCICTDSTEKIEALSQVARERAELLQMFESAPGFVAATSGPEHRFIYANVAYRNLVGIDRLIGKTVEEAMPDIAAQGFRSLLDGVYRTDQRYVAQDVSICVPEPGSTATTERFVNFVYEPLHGDDGAVTGIVCEGFDVTDARHGRERAQALQTELIHVSRFSAMGAMSSAIAHELNQPLTAITSYAYAGRRLHGQGAHKSQEMAECLDGISSAALKAGDIIRGIRRLSQKTNVAAEPLELEPLIREAAALSMIGASGVSISYHFCTGLLAIVDGVQLQQVMMNLIRNAIDALSEKYDGRIAITTERVNGSARISVSDNGPGIEPAMEKSLFDAFATTKPGGLGIGLAISRTIVEAHGGRITASGAENLGATFQIDLPECVNRI